MKTRLIAAALAAFLLLPTMATAAYAGGGEGDTYDCEEAVAVLVEDVTDAPGPLEREENPFTPDGTGTVLDTATDEDGKEFYTIVTPDENVFYLIIDRQRTTENVYFLNAVTEADLLSLAVASELPEPEPATVVEPDPEPEEEPAPEPEPAKKGGAGSFLLVLLIVAAGGGAGYYFKIYRPKQEGGAGAGDDDEYEADPYDDYAEDDYGAEQGDDGEAPWYDDDESEGGEE